MVITYHGEGCFKIQSGTLSVVVDPTSERLKPDVLIKTAVAYPALEPEGNTVIGPGEYELSGVAIRGVGLLQESNATLIKTVYRVELEDIALGFLGEMFQMPTPELLESLGDIDILFLPVGGKPYLDAEEAAKVVKQIEPTIAIPAYYKSPKAFLEEMGQSATPQDKLTLKKKDIIEAGNTVKVVCLTA
jgi:L-ascorbate metabolism protein UlaG (beta-lactamase superfamily)